MLSNCGVREDSWESLDCKRIKPVNPKGNQLWIFIGRTDAEAEAPILWPPDGKSQFIRKEPDAGKDWRQEEKGTTEDELVGWHHWLNGHEFAQTPGAGEGQGSLACCSPWGREESNTAWWLSDNNACPILCCLALEARKTAGCLPESWVVAEFLRLSCEHAVLSKYQVPSWLCLPVFLLWYLQGAVSWSCSVYSGYRWVDWSRIFPSCPRSRALGSDWDHCCLAFLLYKFGIWLGRGFHHCKTHLHLVSILSLWPVHFTAERSTRISQCRKSGVGFALLLENLAPNLAEMKTKYSLQSVPHLETVISTSSP